MSYPNKAGASRGRGVVLAGFLAAAFCFSPVVESANRKDELPARPAIMSVKAAEALLTDVSVAGNKIAVVGERGHILTSTDEGRTWVQGKVPVQALLTGVFFVNEQLGWAIGHEAVILHTRDGGSNWEVQYANPYKELTDEQMDALSEEEFNLLPRMGSPLLDVWFKDEKEGFAVGAYGMLLHTRDGGANWEDWSARLDNLDNWHLNAIGSVDGKTIYIAGEKGLLFRSEDAGSTWSTLPSPYDGSFFGLLVGPQPGQVMVFGLQGNLFASAEAGENWQEIKSPTENSLMAGVALDAQNLILVGNSGTILISKDGGKSFTAQTTKDRQAIVGIGKTSSGKLLMVGQGGVKLATPASL
jgi:photosystem II stability/assembly factor-like uncharacterized protein